MSATEARLADLRAIVSSLGSTVVAYSGGADSALLLKVCVEALGERALAVTGVSPSLPAGEREQAAETARLIGARHLFVDTAELADPNYRSNPIDRCYFCKTELYTHLQRIAVEQGYACVVAGANRDDLGDWRPGLRAGAEHGVRQPLAEAGLTKAEIRTLSQAMGLPTWNKPAMPCLSSRFPYGTRITLEGLSQVDRAELFLRGLGFRQVRVRHHETIARIEIEPAEMGRLLERRERIVKRLRELGYQYVTLDLLGFRSGSLNEVGVGERRATEESA